MPPMVSRVAIAFSRSAFALKYVCVSDVQVVGLALELAGDLHQVVADVAQVGP